MNAIAEPQTHSNDTDIHTATEVSHPKQAFPKGRWTVFKNPFNRAGEDSVTEERVQSEMSLETIKPIRNDLNESDLELFELSAPFPAQGKAKGAEASAKAGSESGTILGKIVRGIFRSKK